MHPLTGLLQKTESWHSTHGLQEAAVRQHAPTVYKSPSVDGEPAVALQCL